MASEMPYSGRPVTTIDQFIDTDTDTKEETCPNDETWCDGPGGGDLPCFECFDPEQEYNVGRSE